MAEVASERPALRVPFGFVMAVFIALGALAIVVGRHIYSSYGPSMPRSLFHVPNDSTYAARINLADPKLTAAVGPLLAELDEPRLKGLASRRQRLSERGLTLESVAELAVAVGPKPEDWLVTASGDLPSARWIDVAAGVLEAEGWVWKRDGDSRLVAPEGLALGVASDGTLILASSRERLVRAQKRESGDPARNVARGVAPDPAELALRSGEIAKRLKGRAPVSH